MLNKIPAYILPAFNVLLTKNCSETDFKAPRWSHILVQLHNGKFSISVPWSRTNFIYTDELVREGLEDEDNDDEEMLIDKITEILLSIKKDYFHYEY